MVSYCMKNISRLWSSLTEMTGIKIVVGLLEGFLGGGRW